MLFVTSYKCQVLSDQHDVVQLKCQPDHNVVQPDDAVDAVQITVADKINVPSTGAISAQKNLLCSVVDKFVICCRGYHIPK